MGEETTIKNCPHCNGTAWLQSTYSNKIRAYFVSVKCSVCGAQGKPIIDDDEPSTHDWNDDACNTAIAAWNLRFYKEGDHVCQT